MLLQNSKWRTPISPVTTRTSAFFWDWYAFSMAFFPNFRISAKSTTSVIIYFQCNIHRVNQTYLVWSPQDSPQDRQMRYLHQFQPFWTYLSAHIRRVEHERRRFLDWNSECSALGPQRRPKHAKIVRWCDFTWIIYVPIPRCFPN